MYQYAYHICNTVRTVAAIQMRHKLPALAQDSNFIVTQILEGISAGSTNWIPGTNERETCLTSYSKRFKICPQHLSLIQFL